MQMIVLIRYHATVTFVNDDPRQPSIVLTPPSLCSREAFSWETHTAFNGMGERYKGWSEKDPASATLPTCCV